MTLLGFGEDAPGIDIKVLNEREIRAAAGMLFALMLVSVMIVILTWNFTVLKYATSIFLADISLRVFVSPRFSPFLILGRFIVRNQTPEYVGAAQKKFAWIIGVLLSGTMFVSMVLLNKHGPINGLICMVCLVFLFCETAFGICLGCMVYPLIYGKKARYCPGEICDPKTKQPIQFTSPAQWGVVAVFAALAFILGSVAKDSLSRQPELVMGMEKPPHIR